MDCIQSDLVYNKQMVVMLLIVDMVNTRSWAAVPDILMHCTVVAAPMANNYLLVVHHTHAMGFQVECTHLLVDLVEERSILVGYLAYTLSHACCLC